MKKEVLFCTHMCDRAGFSCMSVCSHFYGIKKKGDKNFSWKKINSISCIGTFVVFYTIFEISWIVFITQKYCYKYNQKATPQSTIFVCIRQIMSDKIYICLELFTYQRRHSIDIIIVTLQVFEVRLETTEMELWIWWNVSSMVWL